MGVAKVILIGGFGFGLAAWFIHSKSANAAPASASNAPPVPPAGAVVQTITNPMAGTGMDQLKRTAWHVATDASGQQAGTMTLTQNAANPNDWAVSFRPDAGGGGVLAYSKTPNGGLIAQAIAGGQ